MADQSINELRNTLLKLFRNKEWKILGDRSELYKRDHPNDAYANYYHGLASFHQEHEIEAVLEFNEAIRKNSTYSEFYYWSARARFELRNYQEALKNINDALALQDRFVRYYMLQADILSHLNRHMDEINSLKKASEIEPKNYEIQLALSTAYFHQKEYGAAKLALRKIPETDENHIKATLISGFINMFERHYLEAETLFSKCIEKDDEWVDAYYGRGNCRVHVGKKIESDADFQKALDLTPNLLSMDLEIGFFSGIRQQINLMHSTVQEANWGKLEGLTSEFRSHFPLLPQGHFYEGVALYNLGDIETSLECLNNAISISDGDELPFRWRSQVHRHLGNLENALADANKALELAENKNGALLLRSKIFLSLKQFDNALADIDKVITNNHNLQEAFLTRGQIKFTQRQLDGASQDFLATINKSPERNHPKASYYLGLIAIGKKHFTPAVNRADEVLAALSQRDDFWAELLRMDTYTLRADAKLALEQPEDALSDIDKAFEFDIYQTESIQRTSKMFEIRGSILDALDRHEEAIQEYDQALEQDENNQHASRKRANSVNKLAQKQTSELIAKQHAESFANVTNSREIIALYQEDIKLSHKRLHGEGENGGWVDESKISFEQLWIWILFIWIGVTLYFAIEPMNFFGNQIEVANPNPPSLYTFFKYSASLVFLSTPFFMSCRFKYNRAREERTIYLSLKREQIALMFLNAQPKELEQ